MAVHMCVCVYTDGIRAVLRGCVAHDRYCHKLLVFCSLRSRALPRYIAYIHSRSLLSLVIEQQADYGFGSGSSNAAMSCALSTVFVHEACGHHPTIIPTTAESVRQHSQSLEIGHASKLCTTLKIFSQRY